MKIPDFVRIGGVDYDVFEEQQALNDGTNLLYGYIDFRQSTIQLSDLLEHQHKCITLWHEILHGIFYHAGMEVDEEEKIVEVLSRGIYQVLQDNGLRFFDIVSDSDAP